MSGKHSGQSPQRRPISLSAPAIACGWLLALLVLWVVAPGWSHAQSAPTGPILAPIWLAGLEAGPVDAARHVEYIEDPTDSLGIDAVRRAPAEAWRKSVDRHGDVNFGYSTSTYWLRFTVYPATPSNDWRLEVAFPTLDSVTLYGPLRDGANAFHTGDKLPYANRPIDHRHFVFPLDLPARKQTTLYLRVSSQGSLTVPIALWRDEAFAVQSRSSYAVLFLSYGVLLALGLYNLLLYFSLRDRAYLAYVGFVTSMVICQASLNGLGNQYLWPGLPAWGDAAFASGAAATGAFGAIFTRNFLGTASRAPLMHRILLMIAVAFTVCALLPLVSYRAAAIATSISGSVFSVFAVVAACLCWRRGSAGAKWFLLAFVILLAGVLVLSLRNFGLIESNVFTTQGMQIGSAIEMLLLSFALAERVATSNVEKKLAQREALQAKEDLVLSMRVSERILEQRVSERTQALGAANKALERARAELAHQAYYDPLTQLPNRLVLQERLSAAIARAEQRGSGFALLWVDLDGFKAINDQHSYAVGDQVLRELAPRMLDAVRASDLVARFGSDEFVIILENVRAVEVASRVAELLITCIGGTVELAGLALQVEASIGIAIHPDHGSDAGSILESAEQAMHAAKRAGGSRWAQADPALAGAHPPRRDKTDEPTEEADEAAEQDADGALPPEPGPRGFSV
jgi:diguanylate cyclase (GGDEF)-like protein